MRHRHVTPSDLITRINVTPIIDVALVLVTILLVTAPMLTVADLSVDLPRAHTRGAEDERNVSITRTVNGDLALDRQRIAREQLRAALAAVLARPGNANVLVVIRADTGVPYGEIRRLLADARAAGAHRLAVATRQDPEARP
jgi:biopolymer transport protein ExbD